ncbi:hypothetical protein DMB38_13085 [Streptomyces sp. WAC 06738]|nr:hypothetical protein DMB38_13085 [Streptomyces sp. WAC 06738]
MRNRVTGAVCASRSRRQFTQARTGQPVSIRQLRRQLHLGQKRARTLRTRLDNAHPAGAPAPDTAPQQLFDQGRCGA